MVYIVILCVLGAFLSGMLGYAIAYIQEEENSKKSKKNSGKYTGYNGWNYYM